MKKVFIDGSAGTTGLRIRERLEQRNDLELIILPDDVRKDVNARRDALNSSDVAFLCLPDAAAVEAASLVENPSTVLIDTSTAHRCDPDWLYGFPEIVPHVESSRIANPGCHASGFVALVAPLVRTGILGAAETLCASSLTGYSGGGKKMIADYEARAKDEEHLGGRQYALGQVHKHLPEMVKYCRLANAPVFSPIVVPHLSGMEVTVQIHGSQCSVPNALKAIRDCYREVYGSVDAASLPRTPGLVRFAESLDEGGFVSSASLCGRDDMLVSAYGNDDRIVLVALFDNLGKGASGSAIQNMNLALGVPETTGLVLG